MDGILLFNKPILWTSHDAVDFVRGKIGQRAVGHSGTLDPMATGLLVMLLGKATKRSPELSSLDKDYQGTMTLGVSTDTEDLEGRIVRDFSYEGVSPDALGPVFQKFLGATTQPVPLFSAARFQGKKLYEWSRRGIAVQARHRDIFISDLKILNFVPPDIHFFLTCSKGTYVRSLASQVGAALGCGATLSSLVRTRVGDFQLINALDTEALESMSRESLSGHLR